MPLLFETDAERAALTEAWGDTATTDAGAIVCGQYDDPQAEDLLIEGTAPTFMSSLAAFQAASVSIGTTFSSVVTQDRRKLGPFTVVRWQSEEDGAFVRVMLNVT